MSDAAQQLKSCESKLHYAFAEALRFLVVKYPRVKAPARDLERDVNVESDCEDDSWAEDGALREEKEERRKRRKRAGQFLITGSFAACVCSP